jgi:flagellar basal body-associated protein FliL
MGSRYLLSSYSISGKGADFAAKFEKNKPKLLDLAGGILAAKSISDLEKPTIRNLIRSELITAFNTVLGNNAVQEINITEFAIQ